VRHPVTKLREAIRQLAAPDCGASHLKVRSIPYPRVRIPPVTTMLLLNFAQYLAALSSSCSPMVGSPGAATLGGGTQVSQGLATGSSEPGTQILLSPLSI